MVSLSWYSISNQIKIKGLNEKGDIMDKNAVKKFAVNARRKLIDSVSQKAYGLGISRDEIKEV